MSDQAAKPWCKDWKVMVPVWLGIVGLAWWGYEAHLEPAVIIGIVVGIVLGRLI